MSLRPVLLSLVFSFSVSVFAAAAPQVGEQAPEFTAHGSDGKTYHLSDFKGKTVVLEWFNQDCPFVKKFYKKSTTMQDLQKEAVQPKDKSTPAVVWLTVASSAKGKQGHLTDKDAATVRKDYKMNNTALLIDGESKIASLYHAATTPSFFIVDGKGKIVYTGAMDDQPSADPETLKGAHNYVLEALGSISNGRDVKEKSTTPYGCSVKY